MEYRKDPLDYGRWSQSAKQVEKETKLQRLMDAYKKSQISLFDYLNAIAANIEITQYIDDDLVIDYDMKRLRSKIVAIVIEDQLSL